MSSPCAASFPRNFNQTRQIQALPPWRATPIQIAILKTMEETKLFLKTIFDNLSDVFRLSDPC